ncbi:12868_t:CDS:2, partial [Acaulospora colombiana]
RLVGQGKREEMKKINNTQSPSLEKKKKKTGGHELLDGMMEYAVVVVTVEGRMMGPQKRRANLVLSTAMRQRTYSGGNTHISEYGLASWMQAKNAQGSQLGKESSEVVKFCKIREKRGDVGVFVAPRIRASGQKGGHWVAPPSLPLLPQARHGKRGALAVNALTHSRGHPLPIVKNERV